MDTATQIEVEVRKKLCKAWGKRCDKCGGENHVKAACRADQFKKRREERQNKKASVKEVSVAVTEVPASTGAPQIAASAALNYVRALTSAVPPPHSAGYTFDPDRFTDITGSFWKVSTNE